MPRISKQAVRSPARARLSRPIILSRSEQTLGRGPSPAVRMLLRCPTTGNTSLRAPVTFREGASNHTANYPASRPATHPSVCSSKRTRLPLLSPLPSRPHVWLRLGTDQLPEQTTNRVPATVCVSTKPLYGTSGASSQALSLPGAAACPWAVQCGLQ